MSNIGSPFLRLPPELRNHIYGYVLDTSDLVHPATLIRIPKCAAAYYAARVRALVHETKRQPLGTPCRDATLSQLESEEAFIDCPATKLNAFNQLQYVNRQLRFETDQLALKYNRDNIGIVRTDVGEGAPGLQFCKWMIMIRSTYLAQLGQLTITLSDTRPAPLFIPDAVRTIDDLSRLLKDFPNITVKYILPLWTLGLENITYASVHEFVELGIEFVRCFLPNEADRQLLPPGRSSVSRMAMKWANDRVRTATMARNLVVMCSVEESTKLKVLDFIQHDDTPVYQLARMWLVHGL